MQLSNDECQQNLFFEKSMCITRNTEASGFMALIDSWTWYMRVYLFLQIHWWSTAITCPTSCISRDMTLSKACWTWSSQLMSSLLVELLTLSLKHEIVERGEYSYFSASADGHHRHIGAEIPHNYNKPCRTVSKLCMHFNLCTEGADIKQAEDN